MTKNEEYKGFWFLPQNPDNKIPGTLYFDVNEEIRLELIGGFENEISEVFSSNSFDIIHGITSNSENISLFDCHKYSSWNFSSPYPISKFNCHYLINGKHLSDINEAVFNQIQVELSSLYDWLPSGRIRNSITLPEEDRPIEITVSVSEDDYWEKVVKIDPEFELKLIGIGGFTSNENQSKYKFTQNTILEISSIKSKKSFLDLLNKVILFKQFLSLASLSSVEYLRITLLDNDSYQELRNEKKLIHPIPLCFFEEKQNFMKPKRHQFLFKHSNIRDAFPNIIKKWYGVEENVAPIRNHLISSVKIKSVFTSVDFLIIAQALEGYHRRFVSKKDKTLKVRLEELINIFEGVNKITNSPINISHVVNSRNYYSHFFEKKVNVLDGVELFNLTNQLRNLLICCVLRLIGFDIELTNLLFNKNNKL